MLRTILKKITDIQAIIQANSDINTEAEAICRDLACLDMNSVTDLFALINRAVKI